VRPGSALITLLALAGTAAAEGDAIRAGAAVGAGGQGTATYGALELQLDALWRGVRLGLGARGVWDDGVFRRRDWARPADAVTIVRQLEAQLVLDTDRDGRTISRIAIAAGGLAPARIARVVDGHRATLDDRLRTGARGALSTPALELGLEIDDVIDPALIGGSASWRLASPWGLHAAAAVDPRAPDAGGVGTHVVSALELGVAHRWDALSRRLELGGSLVGEPNEGVTAVGFGSLAIERDETRWTASADLRGGNGTSGALFGPLYRLERRGLIERAHGGLGGGIALGVAAPAFSLSIGGRVRPGLPILGTVAIAVPMSSWVQAGGWIAASRTATAGAAEVRLAWARRLSSALQLARMYESDSPMAPAATWSVTAWFGASTD
jgi:hypothetical protein